MGTTTAPKVGTRVTGLVTMPGRGTCLGFGSVTGHTNDPATRNVNGITVSFDTGEESTYRLGTYRDFWELVTNHQVTGADINIERDRDLAAIGWPSRWGNYPVRTTSTEALADSREWWHNQARPKTLPTGE